MQILHLKQALRLRRQYELRKKLLRNSHTYDLVVYIGVIHLKCHVEFEIVPHYSSDDICGHVIPVVDETFVNKTQKNNDLPGMAYMSIGISACVRMISFVKSSMLLTLLVRSCTTKPFSSSSQWVQKVLWFL